ncbi:B- and T-lymphocyte attenuator isoform X1 [Bufo gargarizans]|uniref:B- and T-lymphocyte attenuator isoform X1 n=1 Tax=Bufo gargarizans TaxID=30331 RepID=UPI001CF3D25B|nr:B- and T-lymphocyte attenuator isoform X1 [Bufo gargarizans]
MNYHRSAAVYRNPLTMETLASRRGLLYIVAIFFLAMSLVDGNSPSCTLTINMEGSQKFAKSPGQSLSIKYSLRLCNEGLPNVSCCKLIKEQCDFVRNGIDSSLEEKKEGSAVYVLRFDSVQMNDTGYYRCRAQFKKQQIVGKTIQVLVSGEHVAENITAINTTETENITYFQNFTLLLYIVSSMGGVCVLVIVVSLLIHCQKHFKLKQRSSFQDPAPTEELKFVAVTGSPKNCPQGGTPTLKDSDPAAVTVEVTYDNAHMGYKSTTQNVPGPDEEDSIVYADLKHNAKNTGFQFEGDVEVEYAVVHLNKDRKYDL